MHRLTARVAIRGLAVLLFLVGLAGGLYLANGSINQRGANEVRRAGFVFLEAAAQRQAATQEAHSKAVAEAKAAAARARVAEQETRRRQAASRSDVRVDVGPVPASCSVYTGNRRVGCTLLLDWGFGLDQMPCLDKLWTKESGWSTTATNKSSNAYGIPQALPGNKMSKYGADWRTNPATQIKWGLDYIKSRYSTPCGAWSFFVSHGWY